MSTVKMPSRSQSSERRHKHRKHHKKSSKDKSPRKSHRTKHEDKGDNVLDERVNSCVSEAEKRKHSSSYDEESAKRVANVEAKAPSESELREIRRQRLQAWRESQNITENANSPENPPNEPEEVVEVMKEPEEEEEIDSLDFYMAELQKEMWNSRYVRGPDGVITSIEKKSKKIWRNDKGQVMDTLEVDEYSEGGDEDIEEALKKFKCKTEKIVVVDHSTVDYQPFRKVFYQPVPEIAAMTPEQVNTLRRQMDDIKVKGKKAPRPVRTWAQMGLSLKMLNALKLSNFTVPTPIQSQAVVALLSGFNVIGIAKTGSGKTLAFGLPIIRHVREQDPLEPGDGPIAIVMTPTRELCIQVSRDIRKFARLHSVTVACIYGGTSISDQIAVLKRGVEIVVCTPGRFIDMLAANNGRVTNLKRVTFVCIDESDRMFDLGFEPHVMRILDNTRPDKQVALFSATFPRQLEAQIRRSLKNPIEIQIGERNMVCSDVQQHVVVLEDDQKLLKLLEILGIYGERGSTLVFVDTQENADDLLKKLLRHGYPCMAMHGGVDQYDRESIFKDFKNGDIRLLISTSLASRGLDVRDLILVVNYFCPGHYEDYVHRCGRTGRAGNKGYAFTFITPSEEKSSIELVEALKISNAHVPPELETLAESYLQKMGEQGKKVCKKNGFVGRGYKFNEIESVNYANEQRAMFGFVSDLVEVGDADENATEIENKIDKVLKGLSSSSDLSSLSVTARKEANRSKIEKARLKEMEIPQANSQDIIDLRTRAEEIAEIFHEKLGYVPSPNIYSKEAERYQRFDTELEINDFPKAVRWKISQKDVLSQIEEYACGANITVCGTFVENGKKCPPGERKLYLSIAGLSQMSLDRAKREVVRIIKEEFVDMEGSARYQQMGRYVV